MYEDYEVRIEQMVSKLQTGSNHSISPLSASPGVPTAEEVGIGSNPLLRDNHVEEGSEHGMKGKIKGWQIRLL